ncbi:unnamed protein product, partial [Effrenium voratum]
SAGRSFLLAKLFAAAMAFNWQLLLFAFAAGCLLYPLKQALEVPPQLPSFAARRLAWSAEPALDVRAKGPAVSVATGELRVNGQPFGKLPGKVVGVGGFLHGSLAKAMNFEAFRTWGLDQLPWALKQAERTNMMVVAGLDMSRDPTKYQGPENCADMCASQWWANELHRILGKVGQYASHPRILWWLVGNELETPINNQGGNDCVFKRINWVAQKLKAADPERPVGTAIAGIAQPKVERMAKFCPDLDILGTNIYGNDIWDVGAQLRRYGWHKPWAFTECGTLGAWQVPKTSWGGLMEPLTSTSKGQYLDRGLQMCKADDQCVGFFAFLWGWKWEKTGTWFGMLDNWKAVSTVPGGILNDMGQPLFDEISPQSAWPMQLRVHLEGADVHGPNSTTCGQLGFSAEKGAVVPVDLRVVAPYMQEPNKVWMEWYVTPETSVNAKSDGNVPEEQLNIIPNAVHYCKNGFRGLVQTSHLKEGSYRLYGFARRNRFQDQTMREAAASIAFQVGRQHCETAKNGSTCDTAVKLARTATRRMGVATWPTAGLTVASHYEEFQAALHVNHQGDCPAPCSPQIPKNFTGTCDGAAQVSAHDADVRDLFFFDVPKHKPKPCKDAEWGEDCYWAVKWLLKTGIHTMPEA